MKTKLKAEKEAAVGQLKGELESTKTVLAENKSMLADMGAECKQKGMSFEEKQRMRTEEIAVSTSIAGEKSSCVGAAGPLVRPGQAVPGRATAAGAYSRGGSGSGRPAATML